MAEVNQKRALEFELAKMNQKMTDLQAGLNDSKKTIEIKDGQLVQKSKLVEEHKREVSKMQAENNKLLAQASNNKGGANPAELTRLESEITDLKDQLAAQETLQRQYESAANGHKTARAKLASYAHALQEKANYYQEIMDDVGVDVDYKDPITDNVDPVTRKEVDSAEVVNNKNNRTTSRQHKCEVSKMQAEINKPLAQAFNNKGGANPPELTRLESEITDRGNVSRLRAKFETNDVPMIQEARVGNGVFN